MLALHVAAIRTAALQKSRCAKRREDAAASIHGRWLSSIAGPPTNFYRVLGVSPGASPKEIKMAYLKLAKQFHPDANDSPTAEERFKEISAAYEVLSDVKERAEYDQFSSAVTVRGQQSSQMHPAYSRKTAGQQQRSRGVVGFLDLVFARKGMYVLLASPVLVVLYLGVTSLGPSKADKYESVQVDSKTGDKLVPAYFSRKKQKWLRADSWRNLEKIGPGRQLQLVPEYKTLPGWKMGDDPPPHIQEKMKAAAARRRKIKRKRNRKKRSISSAENSGGGGTNNATTAATADAVAVATPSSSPTVPSSSSLPRVSPEPVETQLLQKTASSS